MVQFINSPYEALDSGDGVYGDAIINDADHRIPRAVIPISGGQGIILGGTDVIELSAQVPNLRAFEGLLRVGGSGVNFGYEYYAPTQGTLTGGYALIETTAIRVVELEYNTTTRVFRVGMVTSAASVAPDPAKFANEEFIGVDTAGNTRTFKFKDGVGEATTYNNGAQSGYKWEWTIPATEAHLWTAAAATSSPGTSWSISAPITVLNYVPHARSQDSGDYLQTRQGEPVWEGIQQNHLPDNIVNRQGQMLDHLGEGYGFKDLGYLLAGQGASVASVFPPAGFDAPAYAYVESEDGSDWDVAILLPDATTEVVYTNRNRILVNTSVHTGAGSIDYDGRSDGDDNYRDAMRSFTLTSFQSSSDDANGYTDLRIAVDISEITDLTNAPTNLYVRVTGLGTTTLTLPRLTGEEANAQGSDLRDYPQYGIQFLHGENNAQSILWYGRGQAILRGVSANDNTLQLNFFTNAAGSQALNIKPVRGRTSGGKTWQSIKPPVVSDWALASNTERIPSNKIPTTGTTILQEGSGSGLNVTSTKADARSAGAPTLFSPTFDLDDTDKQRGLFDIEIVLRFATRSDTSTTGIGFDADLKTDITLEAFHYPSVLRASTAYAVGSSNGVRVQDRIAVMHGTARLGYVHAYLARNSNNELGYYLEYEADNDSVAAAAAAQNFTLQSTIHASFQHEDHTPQSAGAQVWNQIEIPLRYPATGTATNSTGTNTPDDRTFQFEITGNASIIAGSTFGTISRAGSGTDYVALPAGNYIMSIHAKYTSDSTGGGSRVNPEFYIDRSSDSGTTWNEIKESRQGGYKKGEVQSPGSINFTASVPVVAVANERFRFIYHRYHQGDTANNEFIEGQALITKMG